MLSEREKRIIEIRGEISFLKETMEELYFRDDALDEFEMELLRAAIERLSRLEEMLIKLKKGEQ
ncbi:MAG TPA: hypothetical protein ENJ95_18375 [Bacteroidetes bacterium]|nr:hypothetical protein [Bacteroidota bacterium]